MSDPIRSSELEELMKDVVNVSEPDAEFMNSLRARFIAEGHASAKKNQETQMKQKLLNLHPKKKSLLNLPILQNQQWITMLINTIRRNPTLLLFQVLHL